MTLKNEDTASSRPLFHAIIGTALSPGALQVISRHGVHIWSEVVPEKGATFYFTLDYGCGNIILTEAYQNNSFKICI